MPKPDTAIAEDMESPDHEPDRARRGIQSIEVGGEILKILAAEPRPMALRDLVKLTGMPSGKIHPYLVSFGNLGLVVQDPPSGRYLLGPMAIQLGLTGLQTLNPVREATPLAQALSEQTGQCVAIVVWGNFGPVAVQLFEPYQAMHVNIRTGMVMSLIHTASGRAFCAYLPEHIVEPMMALQRQNTGMVFNQPIEAEAVERLIEETRTHQMSRAINHPTPGMSAFAAPVFEHSGALSLVITIMGPTGQLDTDWNGPIAQAIHHCAQSISKRLGWRGAA
jgi:DNA-binding IclR family transcriptional regulator